MERVFICPDFHLTFVTLLREVWRNGKLCDASIEVGSRVFKFHKIVLAIASPVFASMCENSDNKMVIQLPVDTDIQALETVLQCIYGGELKLTTSIVETVQKLGNMLKIDKILEFCELFSSEDENAHTSQNQSSYNKECEMLETSSKAGKRSGLKRGLKPSRGKSRNLRNSKTSSPDGSFSSGSETWTRNTAEFPSKDSADVTNLRSRTGVLSSRGRSRGRGRRGKSKVSTLLRACNLKAKVEIEHASITKETESYFTTSDEVLKESLRQRKPKIKLDVSTFIKVAEGDVKKLENDELAESSKMKGSVNEELNSIREIAPRRRGRKPGKRSSLTRAEIQRAYRDRKFSKMTPEELEAYREKERQRIRTRISADKHSVQHFSRGGQTVGRVTRGRYRGRGRRPNAVQIGGLNKIRPVLPVGGSFDIPIETDGLQADGSKLEVKKVNNKRRNTERQKRYRDRKKLDPEWLKKEAERVRKRYVPVSKLSKKERDLRRSRESERTRLWRWKKRIQKSQLPIEVVRDAHSMDDFSGRIFISGNIDTDFGENDAKVSFENVQAENTVNNVVSSLNDQFNYMLGYDTVGLSGEIKKEALDPDYDVEENSTITVKKHERTDDSPENNTSETSNYEVIKMCNDEEEFTSAVAECSELDSGKFDQVDNLNSSVKSDNTFAEQESLHFSLTEEESARRTEESNNEREDQDDCVSTYVTQVQCLGENTGAR